MRLIDADALIEELNKLEVEMMHARMAHIATQVIVDEAPTIEPVRHGRWVGDSVGVKCTCCGMHDETESIYCPNCGAKMDEEE